jgi:hypothetical protein
MPITPTSRETVREKKETERDGRRRKETERKKSPQHFFFQSVVKRMKFAPKLLKFAPKLLTVLSVLAVITVRLFHRNTKD